MPTITSRPRFFSQGERGAEKGPYARLPLIKISGILKKIGAGDRQKQMYIPNEDDQASFRKEKWEELSRQYSPERYVEKPPFEGDLDEIAMDCYKHGENHGKKTVWRRYRQNYDDLTYHTLRVMRKRLGK